MNKLTIRQVLQLLNEAEAGTPAVQTCRKYGIGEVDEGLGHDRYTRTVHAKTRWDSEHIRYSESALLRDVLSQTTVAAKLQVPRVARLYGMPVKLDPQHYLVLEHGPEFSPATVDGRAHSCGISTQRTRSRGFVFPRELRDEIAQHLMLPTNPPRQRLPRRHYSVEFKIHAVALANSVGRRQAAKRLGIPVKTLRNWLYA